MPSGPYQPTSASLAGRDPGNVSTTLGTGIFTLHQANLLRDAECQNLKKVGFPH
jgi:hypothetical protein